MAISASTVKELRERTGAGMMDCKKALDETGGDMDKAIAWLREKGLSKAAKKAGRATAEGVIALAMAADGKSAALVELKCETDFVAKNEEFLAKAKTLADTVLATGITTAEALPAEVTDLSGLIGKIGENMQVGRLAIVRLEGEGVIGSYIHSNGKLGVLVTLHGPASAEVAKDVAMQVAAANPLCVSPDQVPAETLEQERSIYLNQVKQEGKPDAIAEKIVEGRMRKFYQESCLLEQAFIKDDKKAVKDILGKGVQVGQFVRIAVGA